MDRFFTADFSGLKGSCIRWLVCLLLLLTADESFAAGHESSASPEKVLFLTRLNQPLKQEWEHQKFTGETKYLLVSEDGKPAIQAAGQQSSSGLYKKIKYPLKAYPWLEWEWKLKIAHKTADLRIKEKEDMALGLFVIFSRPWLPWKTKSIAYVWTSAIHQPGQLIMRPHHPYFVLQAGEEKKGRWIIERRNLYEDYKRAYGEYPAKDPKAIALFTDNDQTKEPAAGFYGSIKAIKKLP
ncbi:MAG: DUF3047 domain-containing protein [Desulfobacterales bacterium]|nr:DUF3047 domain-containing protein [Desulfobacterales bacterium]